MEHFNSFIELKFVYNGLIELLQNGISLTINEQEFFDIYYTNIPIINKQFLNFYGVDFSPFAIISYNFNSIYTIKLKKIVSLICRQ